MSKFILGGRLGDLVHSLYVVKNTPGVHDLYITDRRDLHSDGFIHPLGVTIAQLISVIGEQDYVQSIQPYEGEVTEATMVPDRYGYINLNMWRRYVYSDSWTNLLSKVYGVPVVPGPWITAPPYDKVGRTVEAYKYQKIIHCSIPQARHGNWDGVSLHGGVFMGTMAEYQSFNRPEIPLITPHSLKQMFGLIGSCGEFIGNQSLPLAIAHALDVPRTGVLNEVDCKAYVGEELIYKKFKYVL